MFVSQLLNILYLYFCHPEFSSHPASVEPTRRRFYLFLFDFIFIFNLSKHLQTHLQVLEVQVGLVLVSRLVSTMTVRDDRVQQILENLV